MATYNGFHLLLRQLRIEDRVGILSSSVPIVLRRGDFFFLCIPSSSRFSRDVEGRYPRKQRQGGGASDTLPHLSLMLSFSQPPCFSLSISGWHCIPSFPTNTPFAPNGPAMARSCRQSSPEDSAIRTSTLANFPPKRYRFLRNLLVLLLLQ